MTCDCETCEYLREFYENIRNVRTKASRKFFDDMLLKLVCAEEDSAHKAAIIDGTWPDADEYIAHARSKKP